MKDRLVLPILIPVLAAGAILLIIFSAGHALLEAQEAVSHLASVIAILGAATILGVASLLYIQPKIGTWPVYTALAVPASVLLATGLFFLVRTEGGEGGGEGPAVAAIAPPGPIEMIYTDNKFSLTEFAIVAGSEYRMTIKNSGAAIHNVHFRNQTTPDGKPLASALLPGGQSEEFTFTIATPGTYSYFCDIHPVEMVGEATVVPAGSATGGGATAGGGGAASGEPTTTITSVATDNKFDKNAYTIPAGQEITLTLDNKGSAIHNFHIKTQGADGKEPTTTLLTGGKSETIKFTIPKAGTYDFLCDVHPVEMVGKITVR